METVGKTVWWLLVFGAVGAALPHVNPWIGAPGAIFLLAGAFAFFGGD